MYHRCGLLKACLDSKQQLSWSVFFSPGKQLGKVNITRKVAFANKEQ